MQTFCATFKLVCKYTAKKCGKICFFFRVLNIFFCTNLLFKCPKSICLRFSHVFPIMRRVRQPKMKPWYFDLEKKKNSPFTDFTKKKNEKKGFLPWMTVLHQPLIEEFSNHRPQLASRPKQNQQYLLQL